MTSSILSLFRQGGCYYGERASVLNVACCTEEAFCFCSAFASTPPESILPDAGDTVLYARPDALSSQAISLRRVHILPSFWLFSSTIEAILTCLSAGSSNVDAITSAFTLRLISVTSSGRSSMRSIIIWSLWGFSAIALAMSFSKYCLTGFGRSGR